MRREAPRIWSIGPAPASTVGSCDAGMSPRRLGCGVPEHVSNFLERDPGRGQQAGCAVPQLVREQAAQTGLLGDRAQRPAQVGRVEQRAAAGQEEQPHSPAWTTNPTNAAENARSISGPNGDLVAQRSDTGQISIQLANLHGDITATTSNPAQDLVTSTQAATEFGTPRDPAQLGTVRYGWLGAKTRPADNL